MTFLLFNKNSIALLPFRATYENPKSLGFEISIFVQVLKLILILEQKRI